MSANSNLHAAKTAKNDEFYTRYEDINAEINTMTHGYRPHFENATVYCNCDDPEWSNFWQFFKERFEALKLNKLIATHYEPEGKSSYMLEFDGSNTVRKELQGDGDFRSSECVELLGQADIVVTNPPFSLFREYVAQLMEHKKKFVIIGNQNAITYKEFFPYLRDNKVWLGNGFRGNVGYFKSPYEDYASSTQHKDGFIRVSGVMWFTNLDIPKRHLPMKLGQLYYGYEDRYPKYDNYDAINVDKTADIPGDYEGAMGVPITFLDKYCPEQFEILGGFNGHSCPDEEGGYVHSSITEYCDKHGKIKKWNGPTIQKKTVYYRILIRRKKEVSP